MNFLLSLLVALLVAIIAYLIATVVPFLAPYANIIGLVTFALLAIEGYRRLYMR